MLKLLSDSDPIELGKGILVRFPISNPISFVLRNKIASAVVLDLEKRGFSKIHSYIYSDRIDFTMVYHPAFSVDFEFSPSLAIASPYFAPILVGALIISISALLVAFAIKITSHSVYEVVPVVANNFWKVALPSIFVLICIIFILKYK